MKFLRSLCVSALCAIALLTVLSAQNSPAKQTIEMQGEVVDADTGRPLACRLYLQGEDGTWYFPHSVGGAASEYKRQPTAKSVEMHTCLTAHPFRVALPPGKYTLTAEHGKEYLTTTLTFTHSKQSTPLRVKLKRWIDMPKRGWYSGDTHAHRSPQEMPILQAAEDVNVAFPLTFWVTKAFLPPVEKDKNQAVTVTPKAVYADPTHVYWPINTEFELFTVDGKPHTLGAVFALNHKSPLRNGAPPVKKVAEEVRQQGGLLELDKHCWEWTMNIVPLMKVDLYDLANNHIWRTEWGVPGWGIPSADYMRIERTAEGWTEAGWIDYGFQNYYALLNCGLDLRPTGGTGTGFHPVPLGWGRVYVHLPGKFSYEAWVKGLNAGNSFVTNGPLLMVTVDGKEMGHRFQQKPVAKAYHISGEAASTTPLGRIEIVQNGKVVRTLTPKNHKTAQGGYISRIDTEVSIASSSWLLVRCFEARPDRRIRFAHTAPVHIAVAGKPLRPRKEEVAYLIKRVKEEIARSEKVLPQEAMVEYREALQRYEAIAKTAQEEPQQARYAGEIAEYTKILQREPKNTNAWQARGEAYFKSGKITESLSDFDQFLELVPDQKPYHWQRGIALYYAGRFAEGKAQFELHQTVNSQDVENAVWHYLCTARLEGLESAQRQLIPIAQDARIPMAQVHRLFAGKATPEEVLSTALAAPKTTRAGEPLFYANLYLGLYYEAKGEFKKAQEYIEKSAIRAKENGYMGEVARVHAEILRQK
jgi:lipoprotein NlpI